MPFYERGAVRIRYQDTGSGFPLLIQPGGGLSSSIEGVNRPDFNPVQSFSGEYRCIVADLRNSPRGESTGPLEIDRPWDAFTDDHLGLLDHLGIDKFMVMGFCIGAPLIWNLIKHAPDRVVAAVLANPSAVRLADPGQSRRNGINGYGKGFPGWGPTLVAQRPEITMEMVERFLEKMDPEDETFVWTVTREFVKSCPTPILVLPDDIPEHPYAAALETAMMAPNAQMSMYPWDYPKERIPLAVRHIASFLRSNLPKLA